MMKQVIVALLSVLLVSGSHASREGAAVSAPILLSAAESPPLHSALMPAGGALSEIIVSVFRRAGYDASVEFMPWARAMASTRNGQMDGMIGVWHTPERAETMLYSEPIIAQKMAMYSHVDSPVVFDDLEDLSRQKLRMAYVRGYVLPPSLRSVHFEYFWVNHTEQYLKLLLGRRVDVVLFHEDFLLYLLSLEDYRESAHLLYRSKAAVEYVDMHLTMSRNKPGLEKVLKRFNEELKQMKSSGAVERILRKHHLETVVLVR